MRLGSNFRFHEIFVAIVGLLVKFREIRFLKNSKYRIYYPDLNIFAFFSLQKLSNKKFVKTKTKKIPVILNTREILETL